MKTILKLSIIFLVVILSYACLEKKTPKPGDNKLSSIQNSDTNEVDIKFKTKKLYS